MRIAGALTRLYALALTRIVEPTTGHLHHDAGNAYLTISHRLVILPPSLLELQKASLPAPHIIAASRNAEVLDALAADGYRTAG